MVTSQEILKLVNGYLDSLAGERQPHHLHKPIEYVLSLGDKRIRSMLMLLAYNLHREHPEDILMPVYGIETYHNYILLHDDLMDQADLRHGHEIVHKRWDANTAILSDDSMLVLVYQHMAQCGSGKSKEVIDLFTQAALETGERQQYSMDFEHRNDVTEDEYIEMTRSKAGALLACALRTGAILGGVSAEDANNLYRFGRKVGLAFQLQDGLLDVYGNSKVFEKAIGGDIVSNKKTYMLIGTFNRADAQQRVGSGRWMQLKDFDRQKKIGTVTALYNDIGIDRLAQGKMATYYEESKKYLATVQVSTEKRRELTAYAQ